MDSNSIVIVYQHLPRVKREYFFAQVGEKIGHGTNTKNLICLSDNRIALSFLSYRKLMN